MRHFTQAQVQAIYAVGSIGKCLIPPTILGLQQPVPVVPGMNATLSVKQSFFGSPFLPMGFQWDKFIWRDQCHSQFYERPVDAIGNVRGDDY